jgi:hypothetical protein
MNKMLLPVRNSCRTPTAVENVLDYGDFQPPLRRTTRPNSAHEHLEVLTNNLSARTIA